MAYGWLKYLWMLLECLIQGNIYLYFYHAKPINQHLTRKALRHSWAKPWFNIRLIGCLPNGRHTMTDSEPTIQYLRKVRVIPHWAMCNGNVYVKPSSIGSGTADNALKRSRSNFE